MTYNFTHELKSREARPTVPTNNIVDFTFRFNFKLPDPRKTRLIWERDAKGRIIRSKAPEMELP